MIPRSAQEAQTTAPPPEQAKTPVDFARLSLLPPVETRQRPGDGNFGGRYQRPDEEMAAIWAEAVAETRELLATGRDRVRDALAARSAAPVASGRVPCSGPATPAPSIRRCLQPTEASSRSNRATLAAG